MSTSAISTSVLNQQYYQTRQSDLRQLGQALSSGDLAGAQSAFNNITALGQTGPFASGNPFALNNREQDFTAIGTALQSGDLGAAQQAFSNLKTTFQGVRVQDPPVTPTGPTAPATPAAPTSPTSTTGPEIVLNLTNTGSTTNPEQITININQTSGGGDQVALSFGPQGSTPQELTFNLAPNSNEQIVLNLLSASSTGTGSTSNASPSTGLSVTA
ncbi:MAG: hypothetical protein WAM78_11235 [Candidatus Sulfotelmatobacter sp.]